MANANVARGLVPYKYFDGSPYNGAANVYFVAAAYGTALYIGDPVISISGTSNNDAAGLPGVNIATAGAGNRVLGAIVGIVAAGDPAIPTVAITRDLSIYHPASTKQYVLVADDPRLLFWIQDDATGSNPAGWANQNTNLISGTGSTTTGFSGWTMSGSGIGAGATKQLRVIRPLPQVDNDATLTSAKWLVKINQHQNADGVAGT